MYTQALNQIPDWVHEFQQWHVDILVVLTKSQQAHVHLGANWVMFPYAEFEWLNPNFLVLVEPILVPLPPHLCTIIGQFSSTIMDKVQDIPDSENQQAGLSTPAYQTHSRTRGISTGKFHLSFNSSFLTFLLTSFIFPSA